ncbi:hypothetical protein Hanom_Chr11g01033451 [Helianthus anomalus]
MATKCKPQGPKFKNFGFWTKVVKVSKPQGPFWLLTLFFFFVNNSENCVLTFHFRVSFLFSQHFKFQLILNASFYSQFMIYF